jgi:hypothetical protein
MTKIGGFGSISQSHGSADPDPDPNQHQNVMDPQLHCIKKKIKNVLLVLVSAMLIHMRLTRSCIKGGRGGGALSQPTPYKCSIFGTCSADLT